MVSDKLKYAEQIARKDSVSPEHRTEGRTQAAEWIQEHIVRARRWPEVTMKQIAEESGWSRQHIANTLEHYFRPADGEGHGLTIDGYDIKTLLEVYREGYRAGYDDAKHQRKPKEFDEVLSAKR